MGADLYIVEEQMTPEYKQKKLQYEDLREQFYATKPDTPEREEAWERLRTVQNEIWGPKVYFRDAYNDGSIFWKMGLSWWQDVGKILDRLAEEAEDAGVDIEERDPYWNLPPEAIKEIRALVDGFSFLEDPEYGQYYQNRYNELIEFLDHAIENNYHIYASI